MCGVRDGVLHAGEDLAGDEPGEVGHVDHEGRADLVGDLAHAGEVDAAGVGRVAGDEDQRLELVRGRADGVVVDALRLGVGAVRALVEHLAGDVRPEAVGEVAARVERHAQRALVAELVAQRLPLLLAHVVDVLEAGLGELGPLDPVRQDRPEGHEVGVDARVRLDVRVLGAEELAGVLGRDRLDLVDVLAAGVEAVPDRALGVLVRQPRAHGQQDGRGGVVLGGDELERGALVGELGPGGGGDARLHRGDHVERRAVGLRRGPAQVGRRGRVGLDGGGGEGVGHDEELLCSRVGSGPI